MTIQEFDKTGFKAEMKAKYKGEIREIATVDFEEKLIGFEDQTEKVFDKEGEELAVINWVRCENCELIK